MTPLLRESRRTVRRAGRVTSFLVILSATLMAVLLVAFAYLSERQRTLQDSIREDALWAVYQLDRETRTLSHALLQARTAPDLTSDEIDDLTLRYDILYSRVSILDNAKYETSLASSRQFLEGRTAIRDAILSLQEHFEALAGGESLTDATITVMERTLAGLVPVTERMLTDTNTSVSALRADARAEVMQLQKVTALIVLASAVVIGLLILNLMGQLRLTRRATGQLEEIARDLSKAYEAAEAGNRAKSEFMAVMGHEIRTPLNAILGMAELLNVADLPADDRHGVSVIRSSGQALLEIINEILDFAKIEHGDLVLERVPFRPTLLVEEAVNVVAGRALEQGNTIRCTIAEDLHEANFASDPTRIRRVLLNLLSNAVKFTRAGSIDVEVTLAAPDRLRVEVSDTGIGISPEGLSRLFRPFTQEDGSISRRFGGTGLGLAISKKMVEALGGEIGVDSRLGSGSRFWFELPMEPAPASQADASAAADPAIELPTRSILVVEDNAANREVARRFLEKLGQQPRFARDGAEGVAMALTEPFDLILMDMQMPVLDGIAATQRIRSGELASGHSARILAMTANASDTDRARCMEAGMDGFLSKPVTMAQLRDAICAAEARSAPSVAGDVAVDVERRAELRDIFGADSLRALDDSFFADMAATLRELHEALARGDAGRADRTLHTIKGAAANLGYPRIAVFAEEARGRIDAPDLETELAARVAELTTLETRADAA